MDSEYKCHYYCFWDITRMKKLAGQRAFTGELWGAVIFWGDCSAVSLMSDVFPFDWICCRHTPVGCPAAVSIHLPAPIPSGGKSKKLLSSQLKWYLLVIRDQRRYKYICLHAVLLLSRHKCGRTERQLSSSLIKEGSIRRQVFFFHPPRTGTELRCFDRSCAETDFLYFQLAIMSEWDSVGAERCRPVLSGAFCSARKNAWRSPFGTKCQEGNACSNIYAHKITGFPKQLNQSNLCFLLVHLGLAPCKAPFLFFLCFGAFDCSRNFASGTFTPMRLQGLSVSPALAESG